LRLGAYEQGTGLCTKKGVWGVTRVLEARGKKKWRVGEKIKGGPTLNVGEKISKINPRKVNMGNGTRGWRPGKGREKGQNSRTPAIGAYSSGQAVIDKKGEGCLENTAKKEELLSRKESWNSPEKRLGHGLSEKLGGKKELGGGKGKMEFWRARQSETKSRGKNGTATSEEGGRAYRKKLLVKGQKE